MKACQVTEWQADQEFARKPDITVFTKLSQLYATRIFRQASSGDTIATLEQLEAIKSKPLRALTGKCRLWTHGAIAPEPGQKDSGSPFWRHRVRTCGDFSVLDW